jgi:alpha-mannosidase
VTNAAVVLDTVKKAEDSDELILRLYESHGGHQEATLQSPLLSTRTKAWRTNLLEANREAVSVTAQGIKLSLRPFEIVTLSVA